MLAEEKVEKIEILTADKGYDSEDVITYLKSYNIKPVIDIRNQWRGEETRQYKDTDIVYSYDGEVSIVNDEGELGN